MLKLIAAPFAAATVLAILAMPSQTKAETLYPWCAQYVGMDGDATNCGFVTNTQCMATVSGTGGFCYENPAYPVAIPQPRRHRAPRR